MKLSKLLNLWASFGDTPVDNNDCIESPFQGFPIGTDRFEIWHWFEEQNDSFRVVDHVI